MNRLWPIIQRRFFNQCLHIGTGNWIEIIITLAAAEINDFIFDWKTSLTCLTIKAINPADQVIPTIRAAVFFRIQLHWVVPSLKSAHSKPLSIWRLNDGGMGDFHPITWTELPNFSNKGV